MASYLEQQPNNLWTNSYIHAQDYQFYYEDHQDLLLPYTRLGKTRIDWLKSIKIILLNFIKGMWYLRKVASLCEQYYPFFTRLCPKYIKLFFTFSSWKRRYVSCEKWLSKFSSNLYVLRLPESEKTVFTKVSVCLSVNHIQWKLKDWALLLCFWKNQKFNTGFW